jgi:hypothetical protein
MRYRTKLMIQATRCGAELVGEIIVRSCWRTLDRVADVLGRICSHKVSFGFGDTFCDMQ